MKVIFQNLLVTILSVVFTLLLCEGILRIYYHLKRNKVTQQHKVLGWNILPNVHLKTQKEDQAKVSYPVEYKTDSQGFKKFGNLKSPNLKVLFIGDSFTQAEDVSNDSAYYAVAGQKIPIEVFGYGVNGFGTLQEYMILKKYIDKIKPDVVVLQFTSNDFINNCYEIEYNSIQNFGIVRPYLDTKGNLFYKLPKNHATFRAFVNEYSRLLYYLVNRIEETQIKPDHFTAANYRDSFKITAYSIQNIKKLCRANGAKFSSFMVDSGSGVEYRLYQKLMAENAVEIIADVPTLIQETENAGICCKVPDNHWNNRGHRVCGEALADAIEKQYLVKK